MAVMSFAQLKNKNAPESEKKAHISPSATVQEVRKPTGGVMSFAHLKKQKPAQKVELRRTFFKIPAVMQTARLMSVSYCQGCERFIEATAAEKESGVVQYGKCLRGVDVDTGLESWKVIPSTAQVKRCFFNIK